MLNFLFWNIESQSNRREIQWSLTYLPNPNNPTIFPVLRLANYLLYNPYILTTNFPLFLGNFQYEIFLRIFQKVIKEIFDRFQPLGFEKGILGDHSIIKEYIYIAAYICTVSPPMDSICMSAGWGMGPIKDPYIHDEKRVINFWDGL